MNITDDMVKAARGVLHDDYDLAWYGRVSDYIHDGMDDEARKAGLAALKAFDVQADKDADDRIRRALEAAFQAMPPDSVYVAAGSQITITGNVDRLEM
jgi:hypothetical protein